MPIDIYTNDIKIYPINTFNVVINSGFPKYNNIK